MNDRRTFEEFVGFGVINSFPIAITIAFFRVRLRNAGVIEEMFEVFETCLSPKVSKPAVVRSSTQISPRFPSNAIPVRRRNNLMPDGCPWAGMRIQFACVRKI